MSRPTSFIASGFTWKIEWIKHTNWPAEESEADGVTFPTDHLIKVRLSDENRKYAKDTTRVTLMHELLHVCYGITGLTHDATNPTIEDQEEYTIRHLTHPLLAVLRDNPEMTAWMLA